MHNLEKRIAEWRKSAARNVSVETLDELETHLREATERLVRSGMNITEACEGAMAELGAMSKISSEFRKLDEPLWLPVKLAIGLTAFMALGLAIFVIARFVSSRSPMRFPEDLFFREASLLLAAHTFTIALGYTLTLLIGGLGMCFVIQRCFEDFSTGRLHGINRVSRMLASLALWLTILGIVLGALWAKLEWGRYWAWDAKETGGFGVVVWLTCYLMAHRFVKNSGRGILAISMLGNIVVSLAWFGPQVSDGLQYGVLNGSLLLTVAIVVNLAFFGIGFVRPGQWRFRDER